MTLSIKGSGSTIFAVWSSIVSTTFRAIFSESYSHHCNTNYAPCGNYNTVGTFDVRHHSI